MSTSGAVGIEVLDAVGVDDGGGGSPVVGKSSTLRFLVFFVIGPRPGMTDMLALAQGTRGSAAFQFLQPQAVVRPSENILFPTFPETGLGNEAAAEVALADLIYRKPRRARYRTTQVRRKYPMKGNTDMAVLYQRSQYKSKVVRRRDSRRHFRFFGKEKKIMGKRKRPWVGYKPRSKQKHATTSQHTPET